MYFKKIFILLLILPIILLLIPGCDFSQEPESTPAPPLENAPAPPENAPAQPKENTPSQSQEKPSTAPSPPITVEVSFPDGAPPLNHESVLNCVVKAPAISLENMSVELRLPEALLLVSGNLSWAGDIRVGDELEVIRATVEAIETGNWAIEYLASSNPVRQRSFSFYPDWQPAIYVSISENSAEWRINPPYGNPPSEPVIKDGVPIKPVQPPSPSPANIASAPPH